MEGSKPLYAAVRFYKDEQKKIHLVPVRCIKDFSVDTDYFSKPSFWVNEADDEEEESWEAAQILNIGNKYTLYYLTQNHPYSFMFNIFLLSLYL